MANRRTPEINWEKLQTLCRYDASINVCAQELDISHDTLERKIKAKYGLKFSEYKDQQLQYTVLKLKQKMLSKAFDGDNTCLIFSLKNLGKWTDRVEHGFGKDQQSIILKYSLDKPKASHSTGDGDK